MPLGAADQFDIAEAAVVNVEGPDSDNPHTDPDGGLTRFGISQTQNPSIDVPALTPVTAKAFYKAKHWDANACGAMPWPVNLLVFDTSVNQGPETAAKLLQESLGFTGAAVDGHIGPITISHARGGDPWELAARMAAKRMVMYTHDFLWPKDGEGWSFRVAKILFVGGRTLLT